MMFSPAEARALARVAEEHPSASVDASLLLVPLSGRQMCLHVCETDADDSYYALDGDNTLWKTSPTGEFLEEVK